MKFIPDVDYDLEFVLSYMKVPTGVDIPVLST